MSPEALYACPRCSRAVKGKVLRTYQNGAIRLLVCKKCFFELVAEDVAAGKRKPKLVKQPFAGEQSELPF